MTDLTYCYLHMTQHEKDMLDTIGTPDYLDGDLEDRDIDVPAHMVPPNPEHADVLPSQVHPSYPYGNPLNLKHPAARPRRPYDPSSRALFEDMGYAGGGVNGNLRWKELALDSLFLVDEAREEAERAAQARQLASGASVHNPPPPPSGPPNIADDEDDEEGDENENDEDEEEEEDEGPSEEEDD